MKMNNDNNVATGWTCGSLEERELFGEGPNKNGGGPHECTEESMCSWCSMQKDTEERNCARCGGFVGLDTLFDDESLSKLGFEKAPAHCCEYSKMSEEEWEAHREMLLLDREDRRKAAEKQYLEDGIALLGSLKHPNLDAHNKSIDLCIASLTDIFNSEEPNHQNCFKWRRFPEVAGTPPVFARSIISVEETTTDYQKNDGEMRIEISFRGKESGITYRVELIFHKSGAKHLASRIDEVLEANSSYPVSDGVLKGFIKATDFLRFQVSRGSTGGGWDYLCIDPGEDFGLWPGDSVAALLMCLHDDLNTALEPAMYTLRGNLEEASKMAFLRGRSKLSIHRLMAYEFAYNSIKSATSSMPADEVHALVSRIKGKFSDPDYARKEPAAEVDYGLLQEEAWEGDWNDY